MAVNRDRVFKLVAALESDEFKQGEGMLYQEMGGIPFHCCLGVACVVAQREGGIEKLPWELTRNDAEYTTQYTTSLLPPAVQEWYGFEDRDPFLYSSDEDGEVCATDLNDTHGRSFGYIANAFRKQYLNQ